MIKTLFSCMKGHIEIIYKQFNEIQSQIEAVVEETRLSEQYTERVNFNFVTNHVSFIMTCELT